MICAVIFMFFFFFWTSDDPINFAIVSVHIYAFRHIVDNMKYHQFRRQSVFNRSVK